MAELQTTNQWNHRWTRRRFHKDATAVAVLALAPGALAADSQAAALEAMPLKDLDPFGPAANYTGPLKKALHDKKLGRILVERLWRAYERTGLPDYAEWTFIYLFIWWRSLPTVEERLRVARAGRKMTNQFIARHPKQPQGYTWGAIFLGIESITQGILDTLNLLPEYRRRLEKAEALDPTYYYGVSRLLQAKMYTKLPPFPISFGDVGKAAPYLEEIRPLCEGVWATWYLAYAETDYHLKGHDAAFAWLNRMVTEVRPHRLHLAYDLAIAKRDANSFRAVVNDGTYDKYTWDPVTVLPET